MNSFPLSASQIRLLATELRLPGTTAYNIPVCYFCASENRPFLQEALLRVTCGNMLLRMARDEKMDFFQYYGQADESCFAEHDMTEASEEDIANLCRQLCEFVFPTLFDAPLFRIHTIHTATESRVVMILHHLISDGTSVAIIGRQLHDCLAALRLGENWSLANEEYAEYLQAEERYGQSHRAERDKEFWIGSLSNLEEYPQPLQTSDDLAVATRQLVIPQKVGSALKQLTDVNGKTLSPFVLTSSLLAVFIARSRRARGVVIAGGYAGRDFGNDRLYAMRGMFVNLLPLNFPYTSEMTVREALCSDKEIIKKGLVHGRLPLNTYAAELSRQEIDINSLLNYSVVSNSLPSTDGSLPRRFLQNPHNEFPVTVRVNCDLDDRYGLQNLRFEFRSDCFSQQQQERFIDNFFTMIKDAAANPDKSCGSLEIVCEHERHRLLNDFQGKKLPYAADSTIIDLFRQHAQTSGVRPAIADEAGVISYAEADNFTDSLAVKLIDAGVGPEQFVAVMLPRRKEFPLSALAAMKAGAAYLPIDAEYPRDRIAYMLADSKARVLLTSRRLYAQTGIDSAANVIFLEDFLVDNRKPHSTPRPDNLAYLIYTSGSTGNPKGVMIEHRSLAAMCAWVREYAGLGSSDAGCCYASFSFDASVIDLFPILSAGGCLHVIGDAMRFDMKLLGSYLKENKIKNACLPTKFGMEFLRGFDPEIEFLMVGGEKLKQLPPRKVTLLNGYGPTEFTVASSFHLVDQSRHYNNIPIGRPVANSWSYVLDSNNRIVPIGTPGELVLSGIQISRGYLARPDLTAERFVDNPYSVCEENRKMYHTGDLACWNDDGELEFLGRIDSQVKLRGFRIELGEIEAAVNAFPGISNAAALIKNDILIAYFTADTKINLVSLNAALADTLPAYMVPSSFLQVDAFPMTPGGKLDYKKLPVPEYRETAGEEMTAPCNGTQQQLFDLVARVLQHTDFSTGTDLFRAGMTSLSAIKIAAAISDAYGVSFNARHLIAGKTILAVENALLKLTDEADKHYRRQQDYPLTQSQMGVYYECAKAPDSLRYNIPFSVVLPRSIDVQQLEKAIIRVIDTHGYLKTYLRMRGPNIYQVRYDDAPVPVEIRSGSQEELAKYKKNFVKPFLLFNGPLYRICLFVTPADICLLADFHHLICDGGSIDIILRDLAAAYQGQPLNPETFTSFDMALEEKEIEQSVRYREAEAYFENRLVACEGATILPTDRKGIEQNGTLRQTVTEVDRALVTDYCRRHGVTPASLFLAGVAYCISRFANTATLLLSTLSNGRSEARYQNNAGMLVRTLPLVLEVNGSLTAKEYTQSVQETMFATLAHESYPFTRVAEKYRFSPQLMFVFQGGVVNQVAIDGHTLRAETLELQKPKFKLSVHIEDGDNGYRIVMQYNDAVYSTELMRTFAECSAMAVERLAKNSEQLLSRISLLTEVQEGQLDSFNDTAGDVPESVLHRMFEAVVERKGKKTALIARDASLTFSQLNTQANRIAWSLLDSGIVTEDRIAFILPRDSRLIAVMLGIVKAGCAYIPIDPDYPAERIAHVLNDSNARFVIADASHGTNLPPEKFLHVDLLLDHPESRNPMVPVTPDNLCYLIYTSGSTGTPKGVMLTHGGITNYVTASPLNPHVHALTNECHTMLSITTVSFDMFLKESFTSLMNGVTLALAEEEQCQNPRQLAEFFQQTQADAFNATPSRLLQYLEDPALHGAMARCKVIMAGGEGYPATLYTRLTGLTEAKLFNTYGPTEITVSCNAKHLTDDAVSIGPPLMNVHEAVMDKDGNRLPVGVTGELYVGGAGVAQGYWNNPTLSAERFVTVSGRRMYKTGDYARWTSNGDIILLGRTDNQIKLRGLRIELGEIETAVAAYTGIRRAAAVIRKINDSEHICAYYTAREEIDIEELRDFLALTLTRYMVPTAYMQLTEMPATPNGKTDLKALPEPLMLARADYVAPESALEKTFCSIFEDVLGLSRVGATDNFFDLGGTSLLVTRITIEAMNADLQVSFGDIFAHPTPSELAAFLEEKGQAQPAEPIKGASDAVAQCADESIAALLRRNTIENFITGTQRPLGNLLLTGATGFLGIHILKSFLEKEKGAVYCLMRRGRHASLESRLKGLLVYYFNNSFDDLFHTRIFPVEGDVTETAAFAALQVQPIDTVINCAANVRHYAAGTEISDVNIKGVANGIDFSLRKQCRYIQISTTSVAGLSVNDCPPADTIFDECTLYVGQNIENKYIHSKFKAEELVLKAINRGLDGKIMRVGNLMARNRDGEFQINFNTNGFINRLKAYHAIGCLSYLAMGGSTELAPIDSTAEAILLLSQAPMECSIFHPYNHHYIYLSDIIDCMQKRGLAIKPVEEQVFQNAFARAMKDKKHAAELSGIIAYLNMGSGRRVSFLHTVNDYTIQVLYRYNFQWPLTTDDYLDKFIGSLQDLGFFDWREKNV